jgi:hypothetical protein
LVPLKRPGTTARTRFSTLGGSLSAQVTPHRHCKPVLRKHKTLLGINSTFLGKTPVRPSMEAHVASEKKRE